MITTSHPQLVSHIKHKRSENGQKRKIVFYNNAKASVLICYLLLGRIQVAYHDSVELRVHPVDSGRVWMDIAVCPKFLYTVSYGPNIDPCGVPDKQADES